MATTSSGESRPCTKTKSSPKSSGAWTPTPLKITREIYNSQGRGEEVSSDDTTAIHQTEEECELALDRLTRRLAIQREIGDRAGMCRTLFNMGYICRTQGETQEDAINTMIHFLAAYWIAKETGETRVLCALEELAHDLEVVSEGAEGLAVWERLAMELFPPLWE
uniref:Uncharacterized protein n=1 Tax=Candidatus Kentrum sp. LPFa TaxID=2126335 RepID=A0A450WDL9_9GAMM|nr:MAG: hypothetical protein BECKLPF1236B_GA0070989_107210 [Candidatus Kentron sp. LPFa]